MKWYQAIVKRILQGVIFFLFPLMILLFILGKAIGIVQTLILPIKDHLPTERVMGIGIISLISIIIILLLCYFAGIIAERKKVKAIIAKLEDKVLVFVPGYAMMKSRASESISEIEDKWLAVLMDDNGDWKLGIKVDHQQDGFCTVFFPEPPDGKSGEMKLVHESKLKMLNIPVGKLLHIVRNYGKGGAGLLVVEK